MRVSRKKLDVFEVPSIKGPIARITTTTNNLSGLVNSVLLSISEDEPVPVWVRASILAIQDECKSINRKVNECIKELG